MNTSKKVHPIIKTISTILIITFINLNISWAYPADPAVRSTVATPRIFQLPQYLSSEFQRDQLEAFRDIKLLSSVFNITKYLLEVPDKDARKKRLNSLETLMRKELGDFTQNIDLEHVHITGIDISIDLFSDGTVIIPYTKDNKKYIIAVSEKSAIPEKYVREYPLTIAENYIAILLPEDYEEIMAYRKSALPAQKKEEIQASISEQITNVTIDTIEVENNDTVIKSKSAINIRTYIKALSLLLFLFLACFQLACGKKADKTPGQEKESREITETETPEPQEEVKPESPEEKIRKLIKLLPHDGKEIEISQGATMQINSVESLIKIGKPAVPFLIEAYKEEADLETRIKIISVLRQIHDEKSIPVFIKASKDNNARIREEAVGALCKFPKDERVLPALTEALKDPEKNVRSRALDALVETGDKTAAPAIMELLKDENPFIRENAVTALEKLGVKEALPALIEASRTDKDKDVRKAIVSFLEKLGTKEALAVLIELSEIDKDSSVRKAAKGALEEFDKDVIFLGFVEALKNESYYVRRPAVRSLGEMKDKKAVPALMEVLLKDSDDAIRREAAWSLGNIGDKKAVPALIETLKDTEHDVRSGAAKALGELKAQEAVPALIEALKDKNKSLRSNAAEALGKIGNKDAISALIEIALKDEYDIARNFATYALGKIGIKDALPGLTQALLKDKDRFIREKTAKVLGEIGDESALSALTEASKDESWDVREAAKKAIEEIKQRAKAKKDQAQKNILPLHPLSLVLGVSIAANLAPGTGILSSIYPFIAIGAILATSMWVVSTIKPKIKPELTGAKKDQTAIRPVRAIISLLLLLALVVSTASCKKADKDTAAKDEPVKVVQLSQAEVEKMEKAIQDLKSETWETREAAIVVLSEIASEKAIPALIEAVKKEESPGRKRDYLKVLIKTGKPSLQPLIKVLRNKDENAWTRKYVIKALGEMGYEEAIPELIKALKGTNSNVKGDEATYERHSARDALIKIGKPAIPALMTVLDHENKYVRSNATDALIGIGGKEAVPGLIKMLKDEVDFIRTDAVVALGNIGDKSAVDGLIETLEDEDYDIRMKAAEALGKIGDERAVPALTKAKRDFEKPVRDAAKEALKKIENRSEPEVKTKQSNILPLHPLSMVLTLPVANLLFPGQNILTFIYPLLAIGTILTTGMWVVSAIRSKPEKSELKDTEKASQTAEERSPAKDQPVRTQNLDQKSLIASGFDVSGIFESVEASVNNTRTELVNSGEILLDFLTERTDILTEDIFVSPEMNRDNLTPLLKAQLELLLKKMDQLQELSADGNIEAVEFPDSIDLAERTIRANINNLGANSVISNLIVLARRAKRDDQNLIIGLDTSWIPAYKKGKLQHNAINPLINVVKSLGDTLKSIGIDNVTIISGEGSDLANKLIAEKDETSNKLSNIIALASADTINSNSFTPLRSTQTDKRAFLAAVDPTELNEFYEKHKESLNKQISIKIIEMLSIAMELASKSDHSVALPRIVGTIELDYNESLRMVIFLPKAGPHKYKDIQDKYKNERTALLSM